MDVTAKFSLHIQSLSSAKFLSRVPPFFSVIFFQALDGPNSTSFDAIFDLTKRCYKVFRQFRIHISCVNCAGNGFVLLLCVCVFFFLPKCPWILFIPVLPSGITNQVCG